MINTESGLKFFGKFKGRVVDNLDPKKACRVRAQIPGFGKGAETGWALCSNPLNSDSIPSIGETVWIEFEQGDTSFPIYSGDFKTVPDVTDDIKAAYDDDPDNIHKYSNSVDYNGHQILKTPDGILIKDSKGQTFEMVTIDNQEKIILTDLAGNTVLMNEDGINFNQGSKGTARLDDGIISSSSEDTAFWTFWQAVWAVVTGPPIPEPGMGAASAFQTALALAANTAGVPSDISGKINESSSSVITGD